MAVRPVDGNELVDTLKQIVSDYTSHGMYPSAFPVEYAIEIVEKMPTLTPPNEWVSVYDRLPEPGERVLATDCGFVGEFYINKRGVWQRYNVNCHELLMALDILYWMPLPAPPDRRPPEGEEDT